MAAVGRLMCVPTALNQLQFASPFFQQLSVTPGVLLKQPLCVNLVCKAEYLPIAAKL